MAEFESIFGRHFQTLTCAVNYDIYIFSQFFFKTGWNFE